MRYSFSRAMLLALLCSLATLLPSISIAIPADPFPAVNDPIAGTLPGQFDVSDLGTPMYQIKLSVPPGTAGMAPDLSLVYSGGNERGILGTGWALNGISAITRCPAKLDLDGYNDPVDFDGNDRFCLDGQRFVLISGSYGASGSEYRTKSESFTKLVANGQIGNGPQSWTAWLRNGMIAEFGSSDDSRVESSGVSGVLSWQLTSMRDRSGNTYTVQYSKDTTYGESVPLRVDYTSNPGAGLAAYNSVQFEYHPDPIEHSRFVGGGNFWTRRHLSAVKMYDGPNLAWTYNIQWYYFSDTQREQVVGVQECGASGECLPATTFDWYHSINHPTFQAPFTASIMSEANGFPVSPDFPLITGDWNGDGRTDIGRAEGWWVHLYVSTGAGWSGYTSVKLAADNAPNTYVDWKKYPLFAGDWNGDGLTDLGRVVTVNSLHTKIYIYYTSASGSLDPVMGITIPGYILNPNLPMKIHPGVFNGMQDGRNGVLMTYAGDSYDPVGWGELPGSGGVWHNFWGASPTPCISGSACALRIGDWDGDGLSDIAIAGDFQTYFFRSNGSSFSLWYILNDLSQAQGFGNNDSHPFVVGDWNGDGLTDVARFGHNGARFCRSTGAGIGGCTDSPFLGTTDGFPSPSSAPALVLDINRDGISDVGRVGSNFIEFYKTQQIHNGVINDPVQLPDFGYSTYSPGDNFPIATGDFDGDGLTDVARVTQTGLKTYLHHPNFVGHLASITNGIGDKITIEYKNLTNGSVYSKGSGASYPDVDIQPSSFVVSRVLRTDSSGNISSDRYWYNKLRGSLAGSGLVGFERIEETDEQSGIVTKTYYRQDGEFDGLPYKIEKSLSGALLYRKQDTWASFSLTGGSKFPYVASSTEESWDLNGASFGLVSTSSTYDSTWGNLLTQTINRADGSYEKTSNVYNNDPTNWLIGQLSSSTVSKKIQPNAAPTDRHASFVYDATRALLLQEVTEQGSATLEVSKTYGYDAFGNITQLDVSAAGAQPRSEFKQYDPTGRFVTLQTNPLGQSESFEYDSRHGLVTKRTDVNGLVSEVSYDEFGRIYLSSSPVGTIIRKLVLKVPVTGAPLGATHYERSDNSLTPPSYVYYDSQGREVERHSVGFDGQQIVVQKVYDERGNLTHISDPYFSGDTVRWTVSEYDALGRITTQTEPGARITSTIYNGLSTTVVNPLNQSSTKTVDQLGLLRSVQDALGNITTYKYSNHSDLIEVRDSSGHVTLMEYDLRGRRTKITDPDTGVSSSVYDALGQLLSETNSLNQTISYSYDLLGRRTERSSPEGLERWEYDTALHGIGKLARVTGLNGYEQRLYYDQLSRPVQAVTKVGGQDYAVTTLFDQLGRQSRLTYPSGFAVDYFYNSLGFLSEIARHDSGATLWEGEIYNARGQLEQMRYGNGLVTTKGYDSNTGYLSTIKTGTVQDLSFVFDAIGNLTERQDLRIGAREVFQYDGLNRLTQSQVVGQSAVDTTYDSIGNILSRSDVGTYLYGQNGAGPHAVSSVTGPKSNSYSYNAAGQRVSANGSSIQYDSKGNVTQIVDGQTALQFDIGPDDQRIEQRMFKGSQLSEKKTYIRNLYERIVRSSNVEEVHYINTSDGPVAVFSHKSALAPSGSGSTGGGLSIAVPQLRVADSVSYLLHDHLGSVQTITDQLGKIKEVLSFDSWGNRRDPLSWAPAAQPIKSKLDIGYTGHEQLDEVALIHMNGRVYDPVVGRFVSADAFVQAPDNMQSLNRYSYVLNNPLSLTDPSGHFSFKKFWKKAFKFVKTAVKIGIVVGVAYGTGLYINTLVGQTFGAVVSGVGAGISSSIANSIVNGGSIAEGFHAGLKGSIINGLTAGLTYNIGQAFGPGSELKKAFGKYSPLAKAVAHGMSGAVNAGLNDGNIASGFLSGSVAGFAENSGGPVFTIVSSGVASAISGGKFQEGAIRGAFVYIYNKCGSGGCWTTSKEKALLDGGNYAGYYNEACQGGDSYACKALSVAQSSGFWGKMAAVNFELKALLSGVSLDDVKTSQIKLALAKGYADIVGYSQQYPMTPTGNLITDMHWTVFSAYGLPPSTFTATPFGIFDPLGQTWGPEWCTGSCKTSY